MDQAEGEGMDDRAQELARVIAADHDEAACQACLDSLEEYVDAQLAGGSYAARYPAVAAHLDACVACAESYAPLYEARLAEAAAPAAPPRIPAPDLSFLPRPAPGLAELLAGALERLGDGLRLRLGRPLLDALAAAPAPGLALRAAPGGDLLLTLALSAPTPTIAELRLSVYADPADPARCVARAQLALVGRDWPDLAGVRVAARWAGGAAEAVSDAWGEALLAGIPRDRLEGLTVEARL